MASETTSKFSGVTYIPKNDERYTINQVAKLLAEIFVAQLDASRPKTSKKKLQIKETNNQQIHE